MKLQFSRIISATLVFLVFLLSGENLNYISTEKNNLITTSLSHSMQENCIEGLKILHEVDRQVIAKIHEFFEIYFDQLTKLIDITDTNNGKCFLIGAGSSGRIAIDIAARYAKDRAITGIIAGGDSAFIRAREGFEDSEIAGQSVIQEHNVTDRDLIILISASGSAAFNIGCALQARKIGATVCYVYNSKQIPAKTESLFLEHGVIPILIDIGPQAITGSTRLQAASITRLALGSLFSNANPQKIIKGLTIAHEKIAVNLQSIANIIQLEHQTFVHPQSNFRKIKDETSRGYVTFVGDSTVLRDIVMDTVETAPTFSTNPTRMPCEIEKKKAEFQAFLAGTNDNELAWQVLIGRPLYKNDYTQALQFSITQDSLCMRPLGEGNMLIGVAWRDPAPLMEIFTQARQQNTKTALILLSDHAIDHKTFGCDAELILDNLPHDPTGTIATITLKQVLNMISNGTMILLNKVRGNQMIDVNTSNNKLIDRAIRLTQEILTVYDQALEYEAIEKYMHQIIQHKKMYEEKNIYTPSPVKIAITMIYKKIDFDDAIILLHHYEENIEKVCS